MGANITNSTPTRALGRSNKGNYSIITMYCVYLYFRGRFKCFYGIKVLGAICGFGYVERLMKAEL